MKTILSTLILGLAFAFIAPAQKNTVSGDHFLLQGKVYEVDMLEEEEKSAGVSQVIVYQEKEIFVAFFTKADGLYEFYLPVGYNYTVWYGGSAFVNKKVSIDATRMSKGKKPQKLEMDIGLFRPMEGQEFAMLEEPYVKVVYDEEYAELVPDLEYSEARSAELEKLFRKIRKDTAKKN